MPMKMEIEQGLPSYYNILGVKEDSSVQELRRAYRKLAMQWHPDRWIRTPSLLGEAKRKFQQIQQAYSVLSDQRKRTLYDAGLYDPEDEEDEGFSDFVQEMMSLMAQTRKEKKNYSMEELQNMLTEMAEEYRSPSWSSQSSSFEDSNHPKRRRCDSDEVVDSHSHLSASGFTMYGTSH